MQTSSFCCQKETKKLPGVFSQVYSLHMLMLCSLCSESHVVRAQLYLNDFCLYTPHTLKFQTDKHRNAWMVDSFVFTCSQKGKETFLRCVFFKTLVYRKINTMLPLHIPVFFTLTAHVICGHLSANFTNNEPSDVPFPSLGFSIFHKKVFLTRLSRQICASRQSLTLSHLSF